MADDEVRSVFSGFETSWNINMQDSIENKIKIKFENDHSKYITHFHKLRDENELSDIMGLNRIYNLFDTLTQQIKKMSSVCSNASFKKKEYCEKKRDRKFLNEVDSIYCTDTFTSEVENTRKYEIPFYDSGEILIKYENEDLVFDDPNCISVVIDGDVTICNDLTILNGQLNVLTSFDATEILNVSNINNSEHSAKRCIIRNGLVVQGSLIVPFSNLYVVGTLTVGKNVYASDLQVDLSSNLFVGILHLLFELQQAENGSSKWNPFTVTRVRLMNKSNTCDVLDSAVVQNLGGKINEGSNKYDFGSLHSEKKIYVGNNSKLWVRGDVSAGEISIADGGILYNTCGNLKTNATAGLGIHMRDSSGLYMVNSSIVTSRLSVIRSSRLNIKKGGATVTNVFLIHTGSSAFINGELMFFIGLIRDSSKLGARKISIGSSTLKNLQIKNERKQKVYNSSGLITDEIDENKMTFELSGGYFQVLSSSTVYVEDYLFTNGTIEVNQGSELISGFFFSKGNLVVNDGSQVYTFSRTNTSVDNIYNKELNSNEYSNFIIGSVLISNSSSLFSFNLSVNISGFLDIIGGEVFIDGGLYVEKGIICTRSKTYIRNGDLTINNRKSIDSHDIENKNESLFLSGSTLLINGNIVIGYGSLCLMSKSYVEVQKKLFIRNGDLKVYTKSAFRVVGLNPKNKCTNVSISNETTCFYNLYINGNITLDSFSDILVDEGEIYVINMVITTNSRMRTSNNESSPAKDSKIKVGGVVVLQGYSNIIVLNGYSIEIKKGLFVDEFSIFYSENTELSCDVFVDDGGIFIGDIVKINSVHKLVSQDSSKIHIKTLNIHYSNDEGLFNDSKNPVFVSESAGSIRINNCKYFCGKADCINKLLGIKTRESTIYIDKSYPWFIPILNITQFHMKNASSEYKEVEESIDPVAFIIRSNKESKAVYSSNILLNKGEQIRGSNSWGVISTDNQAFNDSEPIKWH